MWTTANRKRYDRSKLRYPSDLTNDEWAHSAPLIPPARRGSNIVSRSPAPPRTLALGPFDEFGGPCAGAVHPPSGSVPIHTAGEYFR